MRYVIEHEIPGRIRVRLDGRIPLEDGEALKHALLVCPPIEDSVLYPHTGMIAVTYRAGADNRHAVLAFLCSLDADDVERARPGYDLGVFSKANTLLMDIAVLVGSFFVRHLILPRPVAMVLAIWRYGRFLSAAAHSLAHARLDVPVLDAAAIGVSFIKRDPKTAGSTMFLLDLGATLEDYTRARSESELIHSLLDMPETAQLASGGREHAVPTQSLRTGDLVVARTGMPISIDGVVERGTAMVNQAALTGEPLAVERTVGDDVFAGTAVEGGEVFVRVKANTDETRLRSIVSLVERSESRKAVSQTHMEVLADRIVPWNFLLAATVALVTRSLVKTSAALMVDYSCALKLTGSIAVLSAMSQGVKEGFTVKGSKDFEAMAAADTLVFDKTGTLTEATPRVACVLALDGWNRREVLRFAACLEEHFPHPVARAVVRAAEEKNLKHRERHAAVEYIVAHGIASSLAGKRVVIGSEHFVVEDEGVSISDESRLKIDRQVAGLSPLYLAVDGELVGVLGIEDPLKDGVADSIVELRRLGFKRVIMLTGDNRRMATRIAEEAGIDEFEADLLPEAKHAFIERLKAEGRRVVMVGDGINDSPALAVADVSIAMGQGTAIAKEVADITLSTGDLDAIVRFRRLSTELMRRMHGSYAVVMAINSALLAAGIGGLLQPQTSSLLHNASTVALSLRNTIDYPLG